MQALRCFSAIAELLACHVAFNFCSWVPKRQLDLGHKNTICLQETQKPYLYYYYYSYIITARPTIITRTCLFAVAIPSVVCLYVMFVHPTQLIEIFDNVFYDI